VNHQVVVILLSGVNPPLGIGRHHGAMIDMTRIAELSDEIGDEDLALILATYLDEAAESLSEFNTENRGDRLHFIRSGALNLGLEGIVAATGDDATPVSLAVALDRSRAAVEALFGEGT
jgi:hypothetical protein